MPCRSVKEKNRASEHNGSDGAGRMAFCNLLTGYVERLDYVGPMQRRYSFTIRRPPPRLGFIVTANEELKEHCANE